jgi:hypothetical protein
LAKKGRNKCGNKGKMPNFDRKVEKNFKKQRTLGKIEKEQEKLE